MAISPIDIKIKVSGSQQVKGEVSQVSGGFDVLAKRANGASLALKSTAKATDDAGKVTRGFTVSLGATGGAAGNATTRMAAMANESKRAASDIQKAESSTRSLTSRLKESGAAMKEFGSNAVATGKAAAKVWDIYKAIRSGGPVSLFHAVVPEKAIKAAGFGMIASGVVGGAALGSTVEPAMTKELRLRAIEGITGSKGAAQGIYNSADKTSLSSVFDLGELTVAAKTLAKDRQFSERLLKASDDLAAASKDEGATPQDVARALGRLRAGDSGEALERFRDFGIGRPDLEAKGLKFDNGGALEDKSVAGIEKAIEAVTKIIEERFGGLSEKLATTTLAGSVSNLSDAFTRAKTVIGEQFIPVLNFGAQTLTTLTTWFANLPEPIIKIIAWGSALAVTLSLVGGALLLGTLLWGKLRLAMFAVRFGIIGVNLVLGLFGTSISQLTMSLLTGMLPSIAMVGAAIVLLSVIAIGIYATFDGLRAVSEQSSAELRNHWSGLGSFWVEAGALLEKIWNHPLFKWIYNAAKIVVPGLGLVSDGPGDEKANGDATDEARLKASNKMRAERGQKTETMDQFKERERDTSDDERESKETSEARQKERAKAKIGVTGSEGSPDDELKKTQAKWQAMFTNMGASQASATTAFTPGIGTGNLAAMSSGNGEIDALQAQLDSAYLAKDKDGTKALRLKLRNAKAAQRAQNKSAKDAEREEKRLNRQLAKDKKLTDKDDLGITEAENRLNTEDRISDLQEQLDEAHDAKDAARVRSLTLQIEAAKADAEYDNDMAEAAQSADGHKGSLETIARIKRARAQTRAERTARKAERAQLKSNAGGQGDKVSLSQQLAMLREGIGIGGNNDKVAPTGATSGGESSTRNTGPMRVEMPVSFQKQVTATGQILIKVFGEVTVDNPAMNAMQGFSL